MQSRGCYNGHVKRSFLKWVVTASVVGLLVALGFLVAAKFVPQEYSYSVHQVMGWIWPSAIFLMATEGIENTAKGYLFVFISVVANVLLYGVVGAVLWCLKRLLLKPRNTASQSI